MILINPSMLAPPADLLEQAVESNNFEPLEHWFIQQKHTGYSFQTIVDFVSEQQNAKRAPSAKSKTRKATTTTQKAMEINHYEPN